MLTEHNLNPKLPEEREESLLLVRQAQGQGRKDSAEIRGHVSMLVRSNSIETVTSKSSNVSTVIGCSFQLKCGEDETHKQYVPFREGGFLGPRPTILNELSLICEVSEEINRALKCTMNQFTRNSNRGCQWEESQASGILWRGSSFLLNTTGL
jgi:hypothetical protein